MYPISSTAEAARGRFIPWIIVGFFVTFILLLSSFVWIAFEHKPSLVTEHAYDKGLAYNRTLERARKQQELGWQAKLDMQGSLLVLALRDKETRPVRGAVVKAWFVHPTQSDKDQSAPMKETAPGRYEAAMPNPAAGLWEARITAQQQDMQFQAARSVTVR